MISKYVGSEHLVTVSFLQEPQTELKGNLVPPKGAWRLAHDSLQHSDVSGYMATLWANLGPMTLQKSSLEAAVVSWNAVTGRADAEPG